MKKHVIKDFYLFILGINCINISQINLLTNYFDITFVLSLQKKSLIIDKVFFNQEK